MDYRSTAASSHADVTLVEKEKGPQLMGVISEPVLSVVGIGQAGEAQTTFPAKTAKPIDARIINT